MNEGERGAPADAEDWTAPKDEVETNDDIRPIEMSEKVRDSWTGFHSNWMDGETVSCDQLITYVKDNLNTSEPGIGEMNAVIDSLVSEHKDWFMPEFWTEHEKGRDKAA